MDADAARLARIDRHPHAGHQMRYPTADRVDHAGDFVSERHRLLDPDRAEAAVMVVMQIRTADAAGGDLDPHFASLRCRIGKSVYPQVLWGMDDDRSHGLFSRDFYYYLSGRAHIDGQHAAVDIDDLAVDIVRGGRGKEHRRADQFLRPAPAAGRRAPASPRRRIPGRRPAPGSCRSACSPGRWRWPGCRSPPIPPPSRASASGCRPWPPCRARPSAARRSLVSDPILMILPRPRGTHPPRRLAADDEGAGQIGVDHLAATRRW